MGAANPIEWLVPPVALAHETFAAVKSATEGKPGLPIFRKILGLAQDQAQPQPLGTPIKPYNALADPNSFESEDAARRRAVEARSRLGASTRASDQLTGSLG